MPKYIAKRILSSIITLWVVVTLTFFLMHAIPGGPFTSDKKLPVSVENNLKAKWGLNKPIMIQYALYLNSLLKGQLGPSMRYEGKTVNEVISTSFPASAKLGVCSVLFALIIGVYMGITAALHHGKWQDSVCMIIATLGVCIPSFVLGTSLIYLLAVKTNLLPAVGFDGPLNYIMPTISLGSYSMAFIARLTRSSLLENIRQDYIKTAIAKGLSRRTVIYKHALKNSLIPVVTYLGPLVAGVLTGSFVIESIFGIPGLGREFVQSISNRDYTTTLGVTVFYGGFLIICNFIVDMLYVVIDPRIKLEN